MSHNVLFLDSVHPVMMDTLVQLQFNCTEELQVVGEDLFSKLDGIHGIVIRSRVPIRRDFIDRAPELKWIARVGSGLENIDVSYAESKGIKVWNAPTGLSNAVGEHALGMLISMLKNIVKGDREIRSGVWDRSGNRGEELDGKTIGIWGYGATGSAFAKKLRGFDVKVRAYDKYKSGFGDDFIIESTPDDLFRESDVISIHIPLNEETNGMIDADFLSRFEKRIYLINTSRGPILKISDLVQKMEEHKIQAAALDVFEYEQSSFDLSKVDDPNWEYLIQSERTILTPHVAGWSHQSKLRMAAQLLDQIKEYYRERMKK